jgi:toxin FitB
LARDCAIADGAEFEAWFHGELSLSFERRILDVTPPIAAAWGGLLAEAKRRGVGVEIIDAYIAATAQVYAMTPVTRNTKDFAAFSIKLANPWDAIA